MNFAENNICPKINTYYSFHSGTLKNKKGKFEKNPDSGYQ